MGGIPTPGAARAVAEAGLPIPEDVTVFSGAIRALRPGLPEAEVSRIAWMAHHAAAGAANIVIAHELRALGAGAGESAP